MQSLFTLFPKYYKRVIINKVFVFYNISLAIRDTSKSRVKY